MIDSDDKLNGAQLLQLSSFLREVNYSCGTCGYQLNLSSSNRNSVVGSNYGKVIKKGIISFFSIDESRFTQIEQLRWIPFFSSKRSWGLFQRRTKLLCRNCGSHIGIAYNLDSDSWNGISDSRIYDIKLRTLLPSLYEDPSVLV
ncbi:Peptide methionine sulfoxide reductase MrsB [Quillaja saponaria]|uniref:Peptide methionine sulfoxide reductase MrsB n=1 Tax=Quillaja saponaria TaxID=32244 RepID=A0AAD7LFD4_QUISA|nr:Peptide methionine sulfoxide reductase MrsB [Quillaja saponaria]